MPNRLSLTAILGVLLLASACKTTHVAQVAPQNYR